MLTWKRFFIITAVFANALLFLAIGSVLFFESLSDAGYTTQPRYLPDALYFGVDGFVLVGLGATNLTWLWFAQRMRGPGQSAATGCGFMMCFLLVLFNLLIPELARGRAPLIVVGSVTFVTFGALWHLRPGQAPRWRCPKCDYDLRGDMAGVCPECGLSKADRETFVAE